MNKITKRNLLFIFGCIPVRLLWVYLAYSTKSKELGWVGLLPAIGFLLIWMLGLRKTGREVFGDSIWWNDLRPLHSILYFCYAYLAIKGSGDAYIPLLADAIVGIIAFLYNRISV